MLQQSPHKFLAVPGPHSCTDHRLFQFLIVHATLGTTCGLYTLRYGKAPAE